MTDEQIFLLIDAALRDDPAPRVSLSGGEPFIFFDRLCRIVAHAASRGARVNVVTNAFWGTNETAAREKVKVLQNAGLSEMSVSFDDFHSPFVKKARVLQVLRACLYEGMSVQINVVYSHGTRRFAEIFADELDELTPIPHFEYPAYSEGRARTAIAHGDFIRFEMVPQETCPSSFIIAAPDGSFVPCISHDWAKSSLRLGHVTEDRAADMDAAYRRDPALKVLKQLGAQAFLAAAEEAGYERPAGGWVNCCHLCSDLFENRAVGARLRDQAPEILREHGLA